jgi:hypothetical protein
LDAERFCDGDGLPPEHGAEMGAADKYPARHPRPRRIKVERSLGPKTFEDLERELHTVGNVAENPAVEIQGRNE